MTGFLNGKKIRCRNGREIQIDLKLDKENVPAYIRLQSRQPHKGSEAIIVPATRFSEFEIAIREMKGTLEEFKK